MAPAFAWITLVALAIAGTAVGLLISALAQSEEVATAFVPIVIIPQIILAGVITRLSGLAEFTAKGFITVYWGQQALIRLLPRNDIEILRQEEGNWFAPYAIVLAHAVVAAAATVCFLLPPNGRIGSR